MATAVVRYTAAAQTDRGRKRSSNEDAYGYSVEHGVYLVCDGMGGAAAGEIASQLAVEEVMKLVTERVSQHLAQPAPDASVSPVESSFLPAVAEEAVVAANQAIHSRAQRNARFSGMGTTLVGILAAMRKRTAGFWILNIGDSRCYRLRDHKIQLCTEDHSLVEEQVRLGAHDSRRSHSFSAAQRDYSRSRHAADDYRDLIEHEAEPGDLFLLCSDGAYPRAERRQDRDDPECRTQRCRRDSFG